MRDNRDEIEVRLARANLYKQVLEVVLADGDERDLAEVEGEIFGLCRAKMKEAFGGPTVVICSKDSKGKLTPLKLDRSRAQQRRPAAKSAGESRTGGVAPTTAPSPASPQNQAPAEPEHPDGWFPQDGEKFVEGGRSWTARWEGLDPDVHLNPTMTAQEKANALANLQGIVPGTAIKISESIQIHRALDGGFFWIRWMSSQGQVASKTAVPMPNLATASAMMTANALTRINDSTQKILEGIKL